LLGCWMAPSNAKILATPLITDLSSKAFSVSNSHCVIITGDSADSTASTGPGYLSVCLDLIN